MIDDDEEDDGSGDDYIEFEDEDIDNLNFFELKVLLLVTFLPYK